MKRGEEGKWADGGGRGWVRGTWLFLLVQYVRLSERERLAHTYIYTLDVGGARGIHNFYSKGDDEAALNQSEEAALSSKTSQTSRLDPLCYACI